MPKPQFEFKSKGCFIDGRFQQPQDPNGEWVSRSPGDLADEIGRFQYSYSAIDQALRSAREAFPGWKRTSIADRAAFLKKYQDALRKREAQLIECIAREVGKPLWESKTEFTAMVNKVDVTIAESMKLVADFEIPKIMENTNGACRYRPLGVMAVIGPFNFPGHLPNGHIVPALMTGNTVVFKPSEKAPMVGQLMAECFHEAGLPSGVFNVLHGEREVGRRLVVHEQVDGVLFTGSYEVGTRIKQDTLQQHWKLLALEMGGKNAAIVCEDADLDFALHETLVGAFITAGQRCSATSRIVVARSRFEEFVERFHERAKAFSIGHPLDNPFMGPLIDSGSVDRYMKFLGIAVREGFELVMRGKSLELPNKGYYVTPSICAHAEADLAQARKSVYQQTELFAPNVAIVPASDVEEAIAVANATQYGLVASVFSASRELYEKCLDGLQMGLVNWNKSTVGASSRLPFGGLKKSGNHFPTALSATLYCTTPVASLEAPEPKAPTTFSPGLNWK
ncbi:MAG TPA: aldehyde dehydrogenase family protein [Bdellovibrionota bacterium]|nr:aldehyde dehydrogenase family protein [Bdellovibrionota bacterium]